MTIEELFLKIKQIIIECDESIKVAIINFCKENNPYKIGDIFTDHIGSVKIVYPKVGHAVFIMGLN